MVHTFFKKESTVKIKKSIAIKEAAKETFNSKMQFFKGRLKVVEVRHLEMPEPMAVILQELELLPQGMALFVEHKKMPQFLLPELKERNFEILYKKQNENHLQLLIFKD